MKLIIVAVVLLLSLPLLGQDYHIYRNTENVFYKKKTYQGRLNDSVIVHTVYKERCKPIPNGKYYFYYDTLSKWPYKYQVYKNGSSTYKRRIGKRKVEVYRETVYFTYYDNGIVKSEEGYDSAAFETRMNLHKAYDSLGNLVWQSRRSAKGVDENGDIIVLTEVITLDKADTISYALSYEPLHYADNGGVHYSLLKTNEYDSITKKQVTKKEIIQMKRNNKLEFFWDYYFYNDTAIIKFDEGGGIVSKTRNVLVNSDKFIRKENYVNDSLIKYQFDLTQSFNYDDSCNYAELHFNGMPKFLKMSLCGYDTLVTKYDSTGEETYRKEFIVVKSDGQKIIETKELTFLYGSSRNRYLSKKEVCKRRRCKCWIYNENGKLEKVRR